MFKARGTRIISEIDATAPQSVQEGVSGFAMGSPSQSDTEQASEALAATMGMGFPVLPPNFRARLIAAQQGDLTAIQEMRGIGDQVPAHMQMAFAEMVQDMTGRLPTDDRHSDFFGTVTRARRRNPLEAPQHASRVATPAARYSD